MNLLRVIDTQQTIVRKHVDTKESRAKLSAEARMFWTAEKAPMEASLIYTRERSGKIEVTPIREGITVGRSRKCAVCLEHSADLSRIHFLVRPENGNWVMEDLGSVNGTSVEGLEVPVMKHTLRDGDLVFAGEQMFLFMNPRDSA
jgi:hypothetical protein